MEKAGSRLMNGESARNVLSTEEIEQFDQDGYLVLPPGRLFDSAELASLIQVCRRQLPLYDQGYAPFPLDDKIGKDPRATPQFGYCNVGYVGCGREFLDEQLSQSLKLSGAPNWLYGKRATISAMHSPKDLAPYAEKGAILGAAKQLLRSAELSLHSSALANVYPGCLGEPGQFHTDTCGFTGNVFAAVSRNRFVLNILMYLSDVDEALAPMRVVPGSHKDYNAINAHVAKVSRESSGINHLQQAGGYLYDEFLPRTIKPPVKLVGKAGTVILMNSSIIHSATENYSSETRMLFNVVYSARSHSEFRKNFSVSAPTAAAAYAAEFRDQALVRWTFLQPPARTPILMQLANTAIRRVRSLRTRVTRLSFSNIKKLSPGLPSLSSVTPLRVLPSNDPSAVEIQLNEHRLKLSRINLQNIEWHFPIPKSVAIEGSFELLSLGGTVDLIASVCRQQKAGSSLRVTVPNIDAILDAYEANDLGFFQQATITDRTCFDTFLRRAVRVFAGGRVDWFDDETLYDMFRSLLRPKFAQTILDAGGPQGDDLSFDCLSPLQKKSFDSYFERLVHPHGLALAGKWPKTNFQVVIDVVGMR